MKDFIISQFIDAFCQLGNKLGYFKHDIRSNNLTTEIYIIKEHALQIEIDWKENDLFMYAVYLKNSSLPDKSIIYEYDDGHWCRKYLEEIYKVKHPKANDAEHRYSEEYLLKCFEFYERLIINNPSALEETFGDNNTRGQFSCVDTTTW